MNTTSGQKCFAELDNMPEDWQLIMTKKEIKAAVAKCANKLNTNFALADQDVIFCCLQNAEYFFVDLTRKIFFDHQTCHVTDNTDISMFDNKHIILIDTLHDNSNRLQTTKTTFIGYGIQPTNITTCCLFVKCYRQPGVSKATAKSAILQTLLPDIYGVLVPDVKLVGYGLDYQKCRRNYINLYANSEEVSSQDYTDIFKLQGSYYKVPDVEKIVKQYCSQKTNPNWKLEYNFNAKNINVVTEYATLYNMDCSCPIQQIVLFVTLHNVGKKVWPAEFSINLDFSDQKFVKIAVNALTNIFRSDVTVTTGRAKSNDKTLVCTFPAEKHKYIDQIFDYIIDNFDCRPHKFEELYLDIAAKMVK